jgi:thioredoxin-related protein
MMRTDPRSRANLALGPVMWLAMGLVLACVGPASAADPVDGPWQDDLTGALHHAQQAQRPMVLLFSIPGCVWCARMLSETADSSSALQILGQVEAVHVDANSEPQLATRLGIQAFPTTVLVNRRGEVVHIVRGYLPAADLVTMVRVLVLHGEEQHGELVSARLDLDALAKRSDAGPQLVALLGQGDAEQRHAVALLLVGLPGARVLLWNALVDTHLKVRVDACAVLAQETGEEVPYDPFAPAADRQRQAALWQQHASLAPAQKLP